MSSQWWNSTTIYHIYPRSFQDSNGDGIGDIQGIVNRLDYLRDLGVETIWVSPFFSSPGRDHGYDVSDYYSIDPLMGEPQVVEILIDETHKRGMKIVFDLVMNHTSEEHDWFIQSRSDRHNPKRDWYIWRPGKRRGGKKPPNNWRSMIGKKGWNYDPRTDEWYYSSFLNFQPDLNWINPEVQDAMFDVARFWLDKGVDGFRLDIFNCLGKNQEFKDNPFFPRYFPTPENNDQCFWQDKQNNINHPYSYLFARELRKVIDEYPDRFLIGEVSGNAGILKKFLGEKHEGLNLVFQFELLHFRFTRRFFHNFLLKMEREFPFPYMPVLVYSNHDIGRGISRVDGDRRKAAILALFQFTGRGVPVLYNGDEIGMGNHDLPVGTAQDPLTHVYKGIPKWIAKAFGIFLNRDDARTPMLWTGGEGKGFTDSGVESWLPFNGGRSLPDVESERSDPSSLWHTYEALLKLRKEHPPLNRGDLSSISARGDVLQYVRSYKGENLFVALNFGGKDVNQPIDSNPEKILFSTDRRIKLTETDGRKSVKLPFCSGVVILLE